MGSAAEIHTAIQNCGRPIELEEAGCTFAGKNDGLSSCFAGLSTEHCFPPEGSKQLEEFNKLQDQIQLDATKSVAGRRRKWTKSFCAEKIAMLIILHHELRAMRERNTATAAPRR